MQSRRAFLGTLGSTAAVASFIPAIVAEVATAAESSVVLAYRGKMLFDAAAFYCPYIPLQMTTVSVDPVAFVTRYGLSNALNSDLIAYEPRA